MEIYRLINKIQKSKKREKRDKKKSRKKRRKKTDKAATCQVGDLLAMEQWRGLEQEASP